MRSAILYLKRRRVATGCRW